MLLSYKDGPAKNGQTVTGAPFNSNRTCGKCHSGGDFGASIRTNLLNANDQVVTTYTPGVSYTFRIILNKTSTAATKYGFQTTAATLADVNINRWGTLPANTHNTLKSAHNYVEHSKPLTPATIRIPWTGPVAGTGTVKFYTAGNLVNSNNATSGDQPVNNTLTITESAVLAVAAVNNVKATMQSSNAVISWSASNEKDVHSYIVEKRTDNAGFKEAATIMAKGGGDYNFTDVAFNNKAYYRIRVTDATGNISFSDPVTLVKPDKLNYKLSLYSHAGYGYVMFSNGGKAQKVQVIYSDMQGRPLSSGITFANEGDNTWDIPRGKVKGIVIVNVITEDGIRTSMKFSAN